MTATLQKGHKTQVSNESALEVLKITSEYILWPSL